jgi:uncharacterized membrane protein YeiH
VRGENRKHSSVTEPAGVTAVGGGIIRRLMLTHVPGILREDTCASAAMFGATLLVFGRRFGLSRHSGH